MRLLVLALIVGVFAGPADAMELTGTLRKINDSGTVVLGIRDSAFPFSYLDHERPVGYTVDLCMRVVDAIKRELKRPDLTVQTKQVTTSDRIEQVVDGKVDLECSTTTNNADRQRQVAFSNTFFLSATRFVSRRDHHLNTIESLRGKTVVARSGTTNRAQVDQLNLSLGLNIKMVDAPDNEAAFDMVRAGQADAFAMDDVILSALVARSADHRDFAISNDALSALEPYGLMFRRDDPAFRAVVDQAIVALFGSEDGPALYSRWFQSPLPPDGLNLRLPIAPTLRHAFEHPSASADPASYAN